MSPALICEELVSGYGRVPLLHGIDVRVERGSIVGLLGPNGSGKTTLMRTIIGLNRCWSGKIELDGEDVTHLSAFQRARRGLALVPAPHRLFLGLTVDENLRLGGFEVRDGQELNARRDRVYHYFPALIERRNALVGHLSGGQQQMCAIGLGLMASPMTLMIDELSMGLAPNVVQELVATLIQIQQENHLTLILVEQDVALALSITERVTVLESGRVALEGPSTEVAKSDEMPRIFIGSI